MGMRRIPSRRSSAFLSAAIGAKLVLWPPIHMSLSQAFRFSSWRFGGWGMYATPHPEFLSRVQVVVAPAADSPDTSPDRPGTSDSDTESIALREFGLLLDVVRREEIEPIAVSLGRSAVMEARALTRRVRALRESDAMSRLASLGCRLATDEDRCAAAFVFVLDPRLDLEARLAFTQVDAYCVRDGAATPVGRFRTDRTTPADIWIAAQACARGP